MLEKLVCSLYPYSQSKEPTPELSAQSHQLMAGERCGT